MMKRAQQSTKLLIYSRKKWAQKDLKWSFHHNFAKTILNAVDFVDVNFLTFACVDQPDGTFQAQHIKRL